MHSTMADGLYYLLDWIVWSLLGQLDHPSMRVRIPFHIVNCVHVLHTAYYNNMASASTMQQCKMLCYNGKLWHCSDDIAWHWCFCLSVRVFFFSFFRQKKYDLSSQRPYTSGMTSILSMVNKCHSSATIHKCHPSNV